MEHMSINTHPEIVPPILYVPVDERTDGELGFSLAHMFDQRLYFWHTRLSTDCSMGWAKHNNGVS